MPGAHPGGWPEAVSDGAGTLGGVLISDCAMSQAILRAPSRFFVCFAVKSSYRKVCQESPSPRRKLPVESTTDSLTKRHCRSEENYVSVRSSSKSPMLLQWDSHYLTTLFRRSSLPDALSTAASCRVCPTPPTPPQFFRRRSGQCTCPCNAPAFLKQRPP